MRPPLLLTLALLSCLAAAPAATRPTTRPTAKPAAPPPPARVRDGMLKGALRFLVPADWELEERAPNTDLKVSYRTDGEGHSKVSLLVTQQAQGIPPHDPRLRQQLAKFVIEGLTKSLKEQKAEILDPPKMETDDRFLLRIHERFKIEDVAYDQVHLYRGLGINLIDLTASAAGDDRDAAKALHDAAATLLMSCSLGPQDTKIPRPVK